MEDVTNIMVTPHDPSKPMTKIFIRIEKWVKIADAKNSPLTNAQIIAKTYILVHKTGLYI